MCGPLLTPGWGLREDGGVSGLRGRLGPLHLCCGSALRLCGLSKCDETLRKYPEPSPDIKAFLLFFLIAKVSSDFSRESLSGHFVSKGTLRNGSS